MNWVNTYEALWLKRIDEPVAVEWERLLDKNFGGAWPDRLVDVLEQIRNKQLAVPGSQMPPDFGVVKLAMDRTLKREMQARPEMNPALASLLSRLRDASPAERWEIVCSPASFEDCRALEEFALQLPGGVVRDDRTVSAMDLVKSTARKLDKSKEVTCRS